MSTRNSRILVVDDQFGNRDAIETYLQSEGYITQSADSGKHALMLIAERPPDLIVLDINMPGMDGYEVATLLKSNADTVDIPIIMITGHTGRAARLVGLNTGVEDYLTKPLDAAELGLKVRNLLRLCANSKKSA